MTATMTSTIDDDNLMCMANAMARMTTRTMMTMGSKY